MLSIAFTTGWASPVKFYSINAIHGISVRETNSICNDHNGFIWASSKTGVLRLSDNDYRLYQLPYETADIISVKLVYDHNQLLAHTNNGQVFKFNPIYNRFDRWLNLGRLLNNNRLSLSRVMIAQNQSVWLATSQGLFEYTPDQQLRQHSDSSDVISLEWQNNTQFFYGKPNSIWHFDTSTGKSKLVFKSDAANFIASSLFYDKTFNRLWIGTISQGLFYCHVATGELVKVAITTLPRQPILAIEQNTDSTLMIGFDGQGIWEINKTANKVQNVYNEVSDNPTSLRGNGIYDLFCDTNNRVWVCTYSGGVSYFDQTSPIITHLSHLINNPNSLINNDVNDVLEDRHGNLWFATNNGISCWNRPNKHWTTYYYNKSEQAKVFQTLCQDDEGQIWGGTYSSGVYVLNPQTQLQVAHHSRENTAKPFNNNFVFDIIKDSEGCLWIAGVQGNVYCYKPEQNTFKSFTQQPVNVIKEFNKDYMLLGCTFGLLKLDKESGETISLLSGVLVQDFWITDSVLWVCTRGNGLLKYTVAQNRYVAFEVSAGLPSNFVNSITMYDGHLWLGTENGLCRFNPQNNTVTTFSSVDLLSNVSFNRHAVCNLSNGQLAWGTNNGVVVFNPADLKQMPYQGKLFFQDLLISGRSVYDSASYVLTRPLDSLNQLTLRYHQNNLALELMALGTSAPGSKFSWMLEGYDHAWTTPTSNHTITYNNLPSGRYTLNIKLYNSSQSEVISQRQVGITIIPPFWKTWWFMVALYLFLVVVVFFMLWQYRSRLAKLHSDEKIRFFANTTHDIRTVLTLISAPIDELNKEPIISESGRYYIGIARKQVNQMLAIATQLLDFQKADVNKEALNLVTVELVSFVKQQVALFEPLALAKHITINVNALTQKLETALDETMMQKVINNLVSNAIKYSPPNSQIWIDLKTHKNQWILSVTDQGIGIDKMAQRKLFKEFYRADNAINAKVAGSGIGLLLIKTYVKLHGGEITCTSALNSGSVFTVTIPVAQSSSSIKPTTDNAKPELVIAPPAPTAIDGAENRMQILVVEDNDDLRNFMQHTLSGNFNVLTATNGAEARDIISTEQPDLVVSDIMMPVMDGFELCRILKSTYETSHIPIILLTALSEKTDQLHGLGLGADDYLVKPFDMTLLAEKIKSIIRNRETLREKAFKLLRPHNGEPILDNKLNDEFIKNALVVVTKFMADTQFDKDTFASEMHVSPSLLYKKMKALTNQSPSDFIRMVRLNKALELLETKTYTVTEISELCGFSSVGYFSTVFKKQFGQSPTEV